MVQETTGAVNDDFCLLTEVGVMGAMGKRLLWGRELQRKESCCSDTQPPNHLMHSRPGQIGVGAIQAKSSQVSKWFKSLSHFWKKEIHSITLVLA